MPARPSGMSLITLRGAVSSAYDRRKRQLYEVGCVVCRNHLDVWVEPEPHHLRSRGAMGKKAADHETIPLCHAHHRTGGYGVAYHAGPYAFEQRYGTEEELLEQTNMLIGDSDA